VPRNRNVGNVVSNPQASDEVREAFDLTSLDPNGVFPDREVPNFKPSMTSLAKATRELAFRVLRSLALGLGQEEVL
jgi:isopenicillin N synthase-like dioxygenase